MLDIVLSGQDAQLDLPGMIVRLRTSEDFGPGYSAYSGTHERLSFEDLQDVVRCPRVVSRPDACLHRLLGTVLVQDKVQQSFGDIIFGNLLSIILCLTGTCVVRRPCTVCECHTHAACRTHVVRPVTRGRCWQIIFFEKKFKCIGGQKIHNMVEQQHQLSEDVKSVVQVVTALKESTEQSVRACFPSLCFARRSR